MKWKPSYNLIMAIISLCALVVSVVLAIFTVQEARKLARDSGALDKPKLWVGFGKYPFDEDVEVLALVPSRCSGWPLTTQLPITIFNEGTKAVTDAKLIFDVPKVGGRSWAIVRGLNTGSTWDPRPPEGKYKRSVSDSDSYRHVAFSLPKLYPQDWITTWEHIAVPYPRPERLTATRLNENDPPPLDGEHFVRIDWRLTYGQDEVIDGSMSFTGTQSDSAGDLDRVVQQFVELQQSVQPTGSFWEGLYRRWVLRPKGKLFLLKPRADSCGGDGTTIYIGGMSIIDYPLYPSSRIGADQVR